MRETIFIPQPEGSPLTSHLAVDTRYADTFVAVETAFNKSRLQTPGRAFIAAAVLAEADGEGQDEDIKVGELAKGLAAADEQLREPGTPFVMASGGVYFQAGRAAINSGLFFRNSDHNLPAPMAVVPSVVSLEADVDANVSPPSVKKVETTDAYSLSEFLTPRHVLTAGNVKKAGAISRKFLESYVLVVGNDAVTAFFRNLLGEDAEGKGAEQRKAVAEEVVKLLQANQGITGGVELGLGS